MTQIRLRDRNQLTLPAAIAAAANLSIDDALEVNLVNGVITLVPVAAMSQRQSIMDFVGMGQGVWGKSKKEVVANIRAERDSWER
jgi:antitoxin component of MazEF toxin-antitoxin module